MALTTHLWTINALATELGISHRVLGKKLSSLKPDGVEQQAGRQVKPPIGRPRARRSMSS